VTALPIANLKAPQPEDLTKRFRALEAEHKGIQTAATALAGTEGSGLRYPLLRRTDPTEAEQQAEAAKEQGWHLWTQVVDELTTHYLDGISPFVQQKFCDALQHWQRDTKPTVPEFADFFAEHAATLTHAQAVMRLLTEAEPRPFNSSAADR